MPQQPENSQTAHPTTHEPARYCRRCGYELHGLTTPRCPECGRAFDLANPRTYRRRPIRRWLRHVKRVAIVLLTIFVLLAVVWGWLYWGWYDEQKSLAELKVPAELRDELLSPEVEYAPIGSSWLKDHCGSFGFVLDRVVRIDLGGRYDITDISSVAELKKLKQLYMDCTSITDLSPLSGLTELQRLSINGTKVKDLSPLIHLTKLEDLFLFDTPTTDPSPVVKLKSLHNLVLPENTITEAQEMELQRAMPGCMIGRK